MIGCPASSVTGVKSVVLENFKILGTTAAAGNGAPAVTVQVAQTSQVTFNNSMIVGGAGGKGADGANQHAGDNGGAPNMYYGGSNPSCPDSNGTALLPIFWNRRPISASSRCCSDTRSSTRRRSTPASPSTRSAR